MAVGDVWRISVEQNNNGATLVNVWHVKFKTIAATIAGAVSALDTNWYALQKTYMSTQWWVRQANCRQLAVPAAVSTQILVGGSGTIAGDALPQQCALVITNRTGYAGRRKRGRLYIGGFPESKQANGLWDGAMTAAFQTYADDLVAAYGLTGSDPDYQIGVWSRVNGGDDPGPYNLAAGFTPISEMVVRSAVLTQRRRVLNAGM